jgi:hypothetical protein
MGPNEATKQLTPPDLANQLFDAAIAQYPTDPREAARQVIIFLRETLVYAISSSTPNDLNARKGLLKSVAESIAIMAADAPPSTTSPAK